MTLLKIGLSVVAFGVVAFSVDLSAAWERARQQSAGFIAISAFVLSLQLVLGGLRWHAILAQLGAKPSARESIRLFYISAFFNSYLWGAVGGDVLRAWLTFRGDVSGKTAVNSVILDRVAALAGVAILVLATAPLFVIRLGNDLVLYVSAILALAGLVGIVIAAQLERLPESWLHKRIARFLQSLGGSIRLVFLKPKGAVPALCFAIAAQVALGVATFTMAKSLTIDVGLIDCIVLMQPVALVANLPISVGGWGVRETAVVLLFALVGVPSGAALILSIQLGILSLLVALPGGLLWLLFREKDRVSESIRQ